MNFLSPLAVVRHPGEPHTRVVGVSTALRGGVEVVEIERGALLLNRAGRLECLALSEPPRAAGPRRRAPRPRTPTRRMLPIPIPSEGDAADAELRPKGLLPADADQ